MSDPVIVEEKSEQAFEVLANHDVDLWLTFCRETESAWDDFQAVRWRMWFNPARGPIGRSAD